MENSKQQSLGLNLLSYDSLSEDAKTQLFKWHNSKVSVERNSWHIYFILQSYLVSTRSLDSQTKCGCILVKDKTIIGTGYNSFVRNIKNDVLPNIRPEKYPFMIHSEHNAILNCAKNGISTDGATAYVTGPPCCSCLQYMYQAGITELYFANANKAIMTENKQYDTQFEILAHLMQNLKIVSIDLDEETKEKIRKIQGL
jgi:dCMP deaminase